MQFYELNSSRMDYRELSADDLDLLTPPLRSAETMQTLGGALSYEQALDWLVDTLRRYQTEGCGWLLALDKPTGVPAALCGLTYEQVGAERVLTANCIVRHELRGIGVIDVQQLFGMRAVMPESQIDLVVEFEPWDSSKAYDRLGIEDRFIDILGKQVPCVTLPIRPGRNLASIVEVAAMNNRHRRYGYNAAEELARKVDLHADLGSKSANQGK